MGRRRLLWAALAVVLVAAVAIKTVRTTVSVNRAEQELAARDPRVAHGPVEPGLGEGLTAFSEGDYARARQVAARLLAEPNEGSRHDEALDLLVESWLAQGSFAQARAATQQYEAQAPSTAKAARRRVDTQEQTYQRDLQQYLARKAKAKRPERAAQLQLLIGHLHAQYGRWDLAEQAYRDVVAHYPKTIAAERAARQLDARRETRSTADGEAGAAKPTPRRAPRGAAGAAY